MQSTRNKRAAVYINCQSFVVVNPQRHKERNRNLLSGYHDVVHMNLDAEIEKSFQWMRKSNKLLDGVDFATSQSSKMAVSLLHLSIEHQKGIYTLVASGVIGSAFALFRPQYEAYVRGVWIGSCATETNLKSVMSGRDFPKINNLIQAIEKTTRFKSGSLSAGKARLWKALNDYTHGGLFQIANRVTENEVMNNHKPENSIWLLSQSSGISLLAANEIAFIARNREVSKLLQSAHSELYSTAP